MGIRSERGIQAVGAEGLGEFLDAAAVVAGEGAEVALQGDAAVHEGADVVFFQDAQVALRVGEQRGVARGEDGVEHVLPTGRKEILRQFDQKELPCLICDFRFTIYEENFLWDGEEVAGGEVAGEGFVEHVLSGQMQLEIDN